MLPQYNPKIVALFWSKVDKTGDCWLWKAATFPSGYGVFGKRTHFPTQRAHRIAYILTYGPIPDDLSVCHRCDTPACVNPAHLTLGTTQYNSADMIAKGRQAKGDNQGLRKHPGAAARGERQHLAVLTADQVRAIRHLHAGGATQRALCRQFGVAATTLCNIVHRRTWRHVE